MEWLCDGGSQTGGRVVPRVVEGYEVPHAPAWREGRLQNSERKHGSAGQVNDAVECRESPGNHKGHEVGGHALDEEARGRAVQVAEVVPRDGERGNVDGQHGPQPHVEERELVGEEARLDPAPQPRVAHQQLARKQQRMHQHGVQRKRGRQRHGAHKDGRVLATHYALGASVETHQVHGPRCHQQAAEHGCQRAKLDAHALCLAQHALCALCWPSSAYGLEARVCKVGHRHCKRKLANGTRKLRAEPEEQRKHAQRPR